jgi:hypothetical protein
MTSKPQCVFCRSEESSDEHVFARWVSRLLADAAPFTLDKTPGRSASGLRTINVKSRAACRTCNGGWMSRSESEAKMLLPPLIRGETIQWDANQQARAARWTFKTALMLDRSSLASRVAPAHHFGFLFEQQCPPDSVTIYLARYFPEAGEEHVGLIGSSYRPTDVDLDLYPDPYHITFSVGQAVFQAVRSLVLGPGPGRADPAARTEPAAARFSVPSTREPAAGRARLATAPRRLRVSVVHELDRLQPDGRNAPHALGKGADADRIGRLGHHGAAGSGALGQHLQVARRPPLGRRWSGSAGMPLDRFAGDSAGELAADLAVRVLDRVDVHVEQMLNLELLAESNRHRQPAQLGNPMLRG